MSNATAAAFAAQAAKYLGTPYDELDCQALMEAMLRDVGVRKNWTGSNAMYRDMAWIGTPEECVAKYGSIPIGAWLYILEQDGGEPAKYKADGIGNASHVGVYTGSGKGAIHSSASRGEVCESAFAGKTIKNGGWNRVGFCKLLDYGLDGAVSTQPETVSTRLILRRGSKGSDVRDLQRALRGRGYTLDIDGIFGQETEFCVKSLQGTHGLERDGIVGPLTWAALDKPIVTYTVHIEGLAESPARTIVGTYGGTMEPEGGEGDG